jgi:putative flippase GtrA
LPAYDLSFARAVLRTWWRERRSRTLASSRGTASPSRQRSAGHAAPSPLAGKLRHLSQHKVSRRAARHRKTRELSGLAGAVQRKFGTTTGKRFKRFLAAAIAAVTASQVTLSTCLGPLRWTAGRSALAAWLAGAAVSYLVSRWAWERKGKPNLLKETIPFWLIAAGTAAVLTLATKAANRYALSARLTHLDQVAFVDTCFFLANLMTFLTRFLIFHYILFSERTPLLRSLPARRAELSSPWLLTCSRNTAGRTVGMHVLARSGDGFCR